MRARGDTARSTLPDSSVTSPAAAQSKQRPREQRGILHRGFYIGFGGGGGTARVDCSRCGDRSDLQHDPWDGGFTPLTFTYDLGWTLRPNLLLGGEVDAWVDSRYSTLGGRPDAKLVGTQMALSFAGAVIQHYPLTGVGLYVKAGVGGGRVYMDDGPELIRATGLAGLLGLGYDIRLRRSLALSPYVHALRFRVGSREGQIRDVTVHSPPKPRIVHAGVAFRVY
jgi:hypothetical protein